jgi:hypothetical protein
MMVNGRKFGAMLDAVIELMHSRDIENFTEASDPRFKLAKREVYVLASPDLKHDWEVLTDLTEAERELVEDILERVEEG